MSLPLVRVLLIEDDEDDALLTRRLLRDVGGASFEIDWMTDLDTGLRRIREGRYDVCLVDYQLGAKNGVDFIRDAGAQECPVPIILLTGLVDHDVDMAAMNAGAADFLGKGQLTGPLLERSIRYSIQQRRAEGQRNRLLREQSARAEAEAANRAKDEFLAVLSHELRTPLTAVLLNLTALEMESEALPRLRDMISVIRRNVDLEARLIDDLLDLTRIARGKLEIRRERVDLNEQVEHAIKSCCAGDITEKGLDLRLDLAAGSSLVLADPARLQQVLWNLLKNATKFTPAGGSVRIATANIDGRIRLSVSDTGIGIAPEALPKIFNAFEQGDRSITRQFGGLGLGLAICRALVELHGGRVWAESEGIGRGATFTIDLPLASGESSAAIEDVGEASSPARGLSILLVEDHADTARAMQRLLTRRGYTVRTANGMRAALKLAEQGKFDVLISDIGLPDGSGHELIAHLRRQHPVIGIALSGFGMEEDVARSRAAGFTEHLTKPIDFKKLDATIARLGAMSAAAINSP